MAEFSTSIDDLQLEGPGQMLQDEVMGPPSRPARRSNGTSSKNPFGLTDEQYAAVIAGVAAMVAFSKPVQERLSTSVPKFLVDGDITLTGMLASALVAAIVFYFAKQFLADRA